jgi:solute carrier family 25 citrate transporter 1
LISPFSPLQNRKHVIAISPSYHFHMSNTSTPPPSDCATTQILIGHAGTNQAVNFTAYTEFKSALQRWQPAYADSQLPSYQTTLIGLVSGAMGPLSNAPIDTIKTRLQKTPAKAGQSAWSRITYIAADMFKTEGVHAFYKGITPRVMRVAPGQAVTFTVYEFLKEKLENRTTLAELVGGKYEE